MRLTILEDPKVKEFFEKRKLKYLKKTSDCWYWLSNNKSQFGYPLLSIGGRKGYTERVSRIMLYLVDKPKEEGLYALHHCDNPACVNPSHLYWGTAKENTNDAIKRNRFKNPPIITREKSSNCYIKTAEDIDNLRKMCEEFSIREISEKLNKSYDAISILLSRLGLKSSKNMRGVNVKPPRKPSVFECPLLEKDLIDKSKHMTIIELKSYYNVSRSALYNQLKRLNIKPFVKNVKYN